MANARNIELMNKFDIHLLTSACSKEFSIKWTLDNFSLVPSNVEFKSPLLEQEPEWRLFLRKTRNQELNVELRNTSNWKIRAETSVSIFDKEGKLLDSHSKSNTFDPGCDINILKCVGVYQKLLSLKDDIVILICDIKITRMFTTKCLSHNLETMKCNGWKKLCEDFKILCNDRRYADVTLKVDGAQVPANKAILSARSAVFERMFLHNMDEQEKGSVKIDDVSLPALKKLVEFLYTGELDAVTDFAMASALYYAADKYEVLDLRQMCADTFLSMMAVHNVTDIVLIAYRHEDEYLKEKTLIFLTKNINCVMESEKWNEFVTVDTKLAAQVLELCVKAIGTKS